MSDRRPFTKADDDYLLEAHRRGVGYCAMARALGRSVKSVKGRADRLRGVDHYQRKPEAPEFVSRERPCARCGKTFETTVQRRMLCGQCFRGADGGLDI